MLAPNDPHFVYRPATAPERRDGWHWVTVNKYSLTLDAQLYPMLADMSLVPLSTEQRNPAGMPYAVLGREGHANRPTLWIADQYAWDGATGGTEIASGRRASCCHDALYQLLRIYECGWTDAERGAFRGEVDDLFRRIQQDDGMSWWRRWLRWAAVRAWPGNIRRRCVV